MGTFKIDLLYSGSEEGSYSVFWSFAWNYKLLWQVSESKTTSRYRLMPGLRAAFKFSTFWLPSWIRLPSYYSFDCDLGLPNFRAFLVLTIIFLISFVILFINNGISGFIWLVNGASTFYDSLVLTKLELRDYFSVSVSDSDSFWLFYSAAYCVKLSIIS